MKTTLTSDRPLEPGVALKISERDETGALVGFYKGYWYPERQAVELYPMHNPFCWWRVPRVRHTVSEWIVEVPGPIRTKDGQTIPQSRSDSSLYIKEPRSAVQSSTSKAMKDLIGQEKMKI